MKSDKITRRQWLGRFGALGAVAGGAMAALAAATTATTLTGCKKSGADCNDLSKVDGAQKQVRSGLKYVTRSTDLQKTCKTCKLYKAPAKEGDCGGCTLFKGPVTPLGHCTGWQKKA